MPLSTVDLGTKILRVVSRTTISLFVLHSTFVFVRKERYVNDSVRQECTLEAQNSLYSVTNVAAALTTFMFVEKERGNSIEGSERDRWRGPNAGGGECPRKGDGCAARSCKQGEQFKRRAINCLLTEVNRDTLY